MRVPPLPWFWWEISLWTWKMFHFQWINVSWWGEKREYFAFHGQFSPLAAGGRRLAVPSVGFSRVGFFRTPFHVYFTCSEPVWPVFPWGRAAWLRQERERIDFHGGIHLLGLSETHRGFSPGLEILIFDMNPHSLHPEHFKQRFTKPWEHFASFLSQGEWALLALQVLF